ncbi:stress responsive A/B barrel domain-containing protein [Lophiotrema nucula]|uniref:Stress responsive A/B barrel domain-containing protein n=1 Tax=Lophiotrema nucula TaxID=690887 RepID=A0A6A5Z9A1_9PLEO|nr:stress responsive A/B barrel domain-containing protein [Lophiotrema nucula]
MNDRLSDYELVDEPLPTYSSSWGNDVIHNEEKKDAKDRGVWLRRMDTMKQGTERIAQGTPPFLQNIVWPRIKKFRFPKKQSLAISLVALFGIIPFAIVGNFTAGHGLPLFGNLFAPKVISCGNAFGKPQNSTVGGIEALFVLDATFGKFKFSQVKVIDVAWDVGVGRGVQLLAWYYSYAVFTDALLRVIERHPASFETFTHVCLEGACLASIWSLIKDLFRTKSKRTWLLFFYMVISCSYVMGLPTILSAMTGYTSTAIAWIDADGSDQIVPATNFQYGYVLYHAGNTTFNDTCLPYTDGEDSIQKVLNLGYQKQQGCDCQLPNGTVLPYLNWTHLYSYRTNYTYDDCSFDFSGNTKTYVNASGDVANCNATVDIQVNGKSYSSINLNYTDGYCGNGKGYTYHDLVDHSRCLPDTADPSYQWGFSTMLSGVFLIAQFVWVMSMYIVWQDAQFNSELVKSGYGMTMLRAAFALSTAARWKTGMSNGELVRRDTKDLKKELYGGKSKKKQKVQRADVDVDVFRETKDVEDSDEVIGSRGKRWVISQLQDALMMYDSTSSIFILNSSLLVKHRTPSPYTFIQSILRQVISQIPIMTITHIVMFTFKSTASSDDVRKICDRFIGLKDTCIHPTSKQPYLVSAKGGTDNSPEGIAGGLTHAFVLDFASIEDRDYYVDKDPVHDQFKKDVGVLLEKAQVIDFEDGVFAEKR